MTKVKGITIELETNTDKMQLKLRAIADELDTIDNAWQCECGSFEYRDEGIHCTENNETISRTRVCGECNEKYVMPIDDELPTRLESSD